MKKLLVMMMFVVGACSTTNNNNNNNDDTLSQEEMKKAFINQVADKGVKIGYFYNDGTGDFENTTAEEVGTFTIYEMIDSNIAIYKSEDEIEAESPYYIYLKFEIKDGKIWASEDFNSTSVEQAKNSTTMDVSE